MRRREIFIELTSLLDVILIMLFILLIQARTTTAQALDATAQAEGAVAEMEAELASARSDRAALAAEADEQRARADAEARRADAEADRADGLQRQLWTENIVLDNSLVLTVSVDKGGAIRLETEGAGAVVIDYSWDDDTYAYNRLRGLLLDALKTTDREAAFLVFQYDRARVYHAEYDMIERIVQEVKGEARERDIPLSVLELDIHEA